MNIVDVLIILLIIGTVVRGFEVGLVRQAGSLIGLIGGLIAGTFLASWIASSAAISLLVIMFTLIACVAAGELLSTRLRQTLKWKPVHRLDQILGGFMGVVACLALVWFGSALVSGIQSPGLQRDIRDSRIIIWLDSNLPPVTDTLARITTLFEGISLPGLDVARETTLDASEATLPSLDEFSSVISAATPALARIEGRSCQGLGTGSGFVVQPGIVVTNAHVVAGMTRPYLKDSEGRRLSAQVIGFNPELDIAVLSTDRSLNRTLATADGVVSIGTDALVMGFPGGGDLTNTPAVVLERFTALGTDIYGSGSTARDVYALKAAVREGNSGGPLLDQEGVVIGVIFARSLSSDDVGYALTMPAVQTAISSALASPSAGQSARCAS